MKLTENDQYFLFQYFKTSKHNQENESKQTLVARGLSDDFRKFLELDAFHGGWLGNVYVETGKLIETKQAKSWQQ